MKQLLLILLLLPGGIWLEAQEVNYLHYSTKEGLPSIQVYDIIQDQYGYIWFSSDRGLSRYNGYEFENFDTRQGLTHNTVFDFHETENGDIWCTTLSAEIFKISGNPPRFSPYLYNDTIQKYAQGLVPYGLHFTRQGELYVSFIKGIGYLHLDSAGHLADSVVFLSDQPRLEDIRSMVLKEDGAEPFFFLGHPDQSYNAKKEFDFLDPSTITSNSIRDEAMCFEARGVSIFLKGEQMIIRSDKSSQQYTLRRKCIASGKLDDDHFWVGLDGGGGVIYDLQGRMTQNYLEGHSVTQVYRDPEGNTWISTLGSGVYMFPCSLVTFIKPIFSGDLYVNDLSQDCDSNLYIGYYNGNISMYNSQDGLSPYYKASDFCPALIAHDPENCVNYFVSDDRVFSNEPGHDDTLTCRNLHVHSRHLFLINDNTKQVTRGRSKVDTIFRETRIYDVEFFEGYYYGGAESGLFYMDEQQKVKVDTDHPVLLAPIEALGRIRSFLLLGSKGQGIALMNGERRIVLNIKTDDGLCGDLVSNLYVESDTVFWVCTSTGISKVVLDANLGYHITSMNHRNGLSSSQVEDVEILGDSLWIGTRSGLNRIARSDFGKSASGYKLLLDVRVNDTLLSTEAPTAFKSGFGSIGFHFRTIAFGRTIKPHYRYKLLGIKEEWEYTSDPIAIFTSLPPGDYQFILQFCESGSCNNSGEINYSFSVKASIWESNWLILVSVLFLVGIVYSLYQRAALSKKSQTKQDYQDQSESKFQDIPSIRIKHLGVQIRLNTDSILYVKSSGNYLEIYTVDKKFLTRMSMADFLKEVPRQSEFIRVHRSYSVRIDKISGRQGNTIWVREWEIPIGRVYKSELREIYSQL